MLYHFYQVSSTTFSSANSAMHMKPYVVYKCVENNGLYTRIAKDNEDFDKLIPMFDSFDASLSDGLKVTRELLKRSYNALGVRWEWFYETNLDNCVTADCDPNASDFDKRLVSMNVSGECSYEDLGVEAEGFFCAVCGSYHDGRHFYEDKNGTKVCDECFKDIELCHDCDTFLLDGESHEVHGQTNGYNDVDYFVCSSCLTNYVQCDECGEYYCSDRIRFDSNGITLCRTCGEDYRQCRDCGAIVHMDDAEFDEETDDWYCRSCWNDRAGRIHNYSYKPAPIFHQTSDDEFTDETDFIYMGVENEIDKGENTTDCSKDLVRNRDELLYTKYDGSLDDGLEIVTHPCTLSYHMKRFPWESICRTALDYNFVSHKAGTCGLHVHVNRSCLGASRDAKEATIAKIALIMERFWDTMVKFSRRDYNQLRWCKKMDIKMDPNDSEQDTIHKIAHSRCYSHDDRYFALNLTNNNTIEFRLFRGTLKANTIIATLQFVDNLVRYCKVHTVKDALECSWNDFALYNEYPEILEYMQERGITNTQGSSLLFGYDSHFKAGDTVRVRSNIANSIGNEISDFMLKYAGHTFTIDSLEEGWDNIDTDYMYHLSDPSGEFPNINMYSWSRDSLELVSRA